jgi:hypothetical protein
MEKASGMDLDDWGDHVEEYSKRQKQLQKELVDRKLMEIELENITSEKTNMTDNNNIQTKTRWSDTERWVAAVIATLGTFGFIYWLYTIGYLIHFGIYTLLTWLVTMVVFLIKHLIDEWVDDK